jgi:hypothetical protein
MPSSSFSSFRPDVPQSRKFLLVSPLWRVRRPVFVCRRAGRES